jgi:hypothetical protein
MNLNFQPLAMFVFLFLFLTKLGLLKVIHPLKMYQHTKLNGPKVTGESFASIPEV